MEQAKAAINKLTGQHGQHTTEVHEHYKPAVTHEQINPSVEHRDTTVLDNEVHQEHHHTSVLPIQHKEVLPTKHTHTLGEATHTEHHHGDHKGIHDRVATEAAQFQDKSVTAATEKTHAVAPSVAGEHHHHHVHETIQPIVQKQTIQPSVVHHTIPVHEVHHNEPKHYTASALPAVSLEEFKKQGGSLTGLADRVERFEGEPENIANAAATHHGHHGHHGHHAGAATTGAATGAAATGATTGHTSTGLGNESRSGTTGLTSSGAGLGSETSRAGGALDSSRTGGTSGLTSGATKSNDLSRAQQNIDSRIDRTGTGHNGAAVGSTGTTGSGLHNTTSGSSTDSGKPSLLQKLNPFKDADGDGKKGLMD